MHRGRENRGAARRFGVDEKRVREWRKLKAEIADRGPKKERLQGGGKKTVLAADKEEQLVSWIESLRSKNLRVTRISSQCHVAELNSVPGIVVALSRNGWKNEKLTIDWMKVWGTLSFEKRLLVWDAYRCHMMDSVKHEVNRVMHQHGRMHDSRGAN